MKIAFIVNAFPILSETFVLNQITGLIDRGHTVDIYAVHPENQPVVHADIEKYQLLAHTFYRGNIVKIMPVEWSSRFIKAMGLIAANFYKNPLALLNSLNVFKFGREAASLRLFYYIEPFLGQPLKEYDIVHCHFGQNGHLGALLKDVGLLKAGCKIITTVHSGYDVSMYVRQQGPGAYNYLFEKGDLLAPISDKWKKDLIELGCPRDKIVVHRMGVDTSKFQFIPRRSGPDGRVCLLTVARLVEKKGIAYAIQVVAQVLKKYPQLVYYIVGDGPLREDLQILIETLKVTDQVKLLEWQRQEEIVEFMQQAQLFLAPSVTAADGDQEGIPVVLMEALAQGLPVLSTWHTGIPELVQDGQSGFLTPERDVEALAEKLIYLLEHAELWPEMGRSGRHYVETHYNIDKLNDQLVKLYQHLLADVGSPGQLAQPLADSLTNSDFFGSDAR